MLSDNDFQKILHYFNRPWAGYRKVRKGVKKRIRRHMNALGCDTVEQFLQIIDSLPEARARCEQCLLVTISRFFRDRQLWLHLQTHVFQKIANRFPTPTHIWSAGCASGEEPYSLAMAWQTLPQPPPLDLLATDINPASLERARQGRYNRSSLKEVNDEMRTRFFTPRRGGRQYIIKQNLLQPITWQQHHLFQPPPEGPFQMILLRNNLLTYHQGETLQNAFQQIVQTLSPKGYLVVGSHEKLPETDIKLVRDPHCPWVFQKM